MKKLVYLFAFGKCQQNGKTQAIARLNLYEEKKINLILTGI